MVLLPPLTPRQLNWVQCWAAAGCLGWGVLWLVLDTGQTLKSTMDDASALWLVLSMVGALLAHELLHALAAVFCGQSKGVRILFKPRSGMLATSFKNPMPREAYLVVALAPFVVLTLLPLAGALAGVDVFRNAYWLAASAMNFGGAAVDLWVASAVWRAPRGWRIHYEAEQGYLAMENA